MEDEEILMMMDSTHPELVRESPLVKKCMFFLCEFYDHYQDVQDPVEKARLRELMDKTIDSWSI